MGIRSFFGWGLAEGQRAPSFSMKGSDSKLYTLDQFLGKSIILYFYPKAFTSSCTAQACSFRSAYQSLMNNGYVLLGVSTDPVEVLQSFTRKYELPFPMLSDENKKVSRGYQVLTPIGVANRVTFLINKIGIVEKTFRFLSPATYADQIIERQSVSST